MKPTLVLALAMSAVAGRLDAQQAQAGPLTYRGLRAGMSSTTALRLLRSAAVAPDSLVCVRMRAQIRTRVCTLEHAALPPDKAPFRVGLLLDESTQQIISATFEREAPFDTDSTFQVWFLALQARWGPPEETYGGYIATWRRGRVTAEWEHNVVISGNDSLKVTLQDTVLIERFRARFNQFRANGVEP